MRELLLAVCAALLAAPTAASDLDALQRLTQSEFRALSEDLAALLSYKALLPAEPLGVLGFDAGVAITATQLRNDALWRKASKGGDFSSTLVVPTLRLHKGLPGNVDVGAAFASVPGSNVRYYGGELRWAVVEGGALTPAVALRAAISKLAGVDQLGFETRSFDVSVSKGLAMLTPYAGAGQVWTRSSPQGVAVLGGEKFSQAKVFAGLNANFALVNVAFEIDRTGETTSGGVKIGLRF